VLLTPGNREVVYNDVAIQPDGKIVLAGYIRSSAGDNDIAVTRLNPNGTPDQGFAAGGTLAINTTFGGLRREDVGNAVALQPDGKVVVAGQTDIPTGLSATIARVLANGTLDPAFAPGDDDGRHRRGGRQGRQDHCRGRPGARRRLVGGAPQSERLA
jgi:uncharacterized delta-60 repeat protein